jgi:hypothetical protein
MDLTKIAIFGFLALVVLCWSIEPALAIEKEKVSEDSSSKSSSEQGSEKQGSGITFRTMDKKNHESKIPQKYYTISKRVCEKYAESDKKFYENLSCTNFLAAELEKGHALDYPMTKKEMSKIEQIAKEIIQDSC